MQKIGVTMKIRNLCMNNSVEALISFNEGHQSLLKLHLHLGWRWGSSIGRANGARLCCMASGKSSVRRWYFMLKCDVIEGTLVA